MIDLKIFEKIYFETDNWVQICIQDDKETDYIKRKVYKILCDSALPPFWYIFNKDPFCIFKIYTPGQKTACLREAAALINEITDAHIHCFLPEYHQFGGVESWNYCVKWFHEITHMYFAQTSGCDVLAKEIVFNCLKQMGYDERIKVINNLCSIRRIPHCVGLKSDWKIENKVIDVKQYYLQTENSILYPYHTIWPYVFIFIFNILNIDGLKQREIINMLLQK